MKALDGLLLAGFFGGEIVVLSAGREGMLYNGE